MVEWFGQSVNSYHDYVSRPLSKLGMYLPALNVLRMPVMPTKVSTTMRVQTRGLVKWSSLVYPTPPISRKCTSKPNLRSLDPLTLAVNPTRIHPLTSPYVLLRRWCDPLGWRSSNSYSMAKIV